MASISGGQVTSLDEVAAASHVIQGRGGEVLMLQTS